MALTISQADTISNHGIDKTIQQQVYDQSPLWTKLKQGNKIKAGGTDLRMNIRYRKYDRARSVGPREQITFEMKDTRTAAVDSWGFYEVDTMITWDERVYNAGAEKIIDLVRDKVTELKDDMYERFATDLFTQSSAENPLRSLATMVDSTTAYAGIAVADATTWKSTESASVTLTLYSGANSLAYMVAHSTHGTAKPTIHITTVDLQNKFESLMASNIRYEDVAMANAGFANVTFRRAPVIGDLHCPAAAWYGLDTGNMEIRYNPESNFDITPWIDGTPLGFPKALLKVMVWAGQLMLKSRRTCFKYTALDYTK